MSPSFLIVAEIFQLAMLVSRSKIERGFPIEDTSNSARCCPNARAVSFTDGAARGRHGMCGAVKVRRNAPDTPARARSGRALHLCAALRAQPLYR